jgi:hypothetical protein
MALALTFFECYHKDCNEFLNHIVQVTGDEAWVSFVNVETKGQSKLWMQTHSPNRTKSLNKRLPENTSNLFHAPCVPLETM